LWGWGKPRSIAWLIVNLTQKMRSRITKVFLGTLIVACGIGMTVLAIRFVMAPKPLNLTEAALDGKIQVGDAEAVVYQTLGKPVTERVNPAGEKSFVYFNSRRRESGNFEVPLTVTYYIRDGIVVDRLFRVK
jgi:hypothetical protein